MTFTLHRMQIAASSIARSTQSSEDKGVPWDAASHGDGVVVTGFASGLLAVSSTLRRWCGEKRPPYETDKVDDESDTPTSLTRYIGGACSGPCCTREYRLK
jgi:hypothetical protein